VQAYRGFESHPIRFPEKRRADACPYRHSKERVFPLQKKCELDTGIAVKSIGELGGIRTLDLQIKSPLLYQLSYELPFNNYPDRA
jgi:hypothetical protein